MLVRTGADQLKSQIYSRCGRLIANYHQVNHLIMQKKKMNEIQIFPVRSNDSKKSQWTYFKSGNICRIALIFSQFFCCIEHSNLELFD